MSPTTPPRLLVVDDETTLLDLLRRYLERSGYEVETWPDPQQALESFQANPNRFAMVIADLTLPVMTGDELIKEIRAIHPTIPALLSSGYPFVPSVPNVEFLQKPFLPKMLVEAVEKALKA